MSRAVPSWYFPAALRMEVLKVSLVVEQFGSSSIPLGFLIIVPRQHLCIISYTTIMSKIYDDRNENIVSVSLTVSGCRAFFKVLVM